jgi:tetratricopeptide (TPR) repeat protein
MFNTTVCLDGALDVRPDHVSLSLQLNNAASGAAIASEDIVTRASNTAVLQSEPAVAAARLLGLPTDDDSMDALTWAPTNVAPAFLAAIEAEGLLIAGPGPDDAARAAALLEEAVAADPLYDRAWVDLADACREQYEATGNEARLARGFEAAKTALSLRESAAAYQALAALHAANGDAKGRIAALEAAARIDPDAAEVSYGLGVALIEARRKAAAVAALQRAINLRPCYWLYHNELADLYYNSGEYDSAANHWRRVTECAPRYDGGYANLGIANFRLDDIAMAKRNFERAIDLNPRSNANTYLNLGSLYFADARFADAASMFETALELDEGAYFIWGNLGFSLAYGLEPERARHAFTRAVELAEQELEDRPGDAELLSDLAGYHAALGHEERTRECLTRAIALDPTDPLVLATIAESYEDIGDRDRALEWVERAFAAGATPSRFETRPTLRGLIADPRYRALTTGANQRVASTTQSDRRMS